MSGVNREGITGVMITTCPTCAIFSCEMFNNVEIYVQGFQAEIIVSEGVENLPQNIFADFKSWKSGNQWPP